jgi:hypothetical protein
MANSLALWFRRTYQLAPTDPRFLAATLEDIEAEYWAYHYQDKKVVEEFEDEDFDQEAELRRIEEAAEARERAAAAAAASASSDAAPVVADPSDSLDLSGVDDWEDVDL